MTEKKIEATELTPFEKGMRELRKPFPKECYGKLFKAYKKNPQAPRANCRECGQYHSVEPGVHLDYVGHAAVTDRLLTVDPYWTWKPMARRPDGGIAFVRNQAGQALGLEIELTVLGVTRPGQGSVEPGAFDAEKQLIGDALRNAAMRFGVALDLWSKGELESDVDEAPAPAPQQQRKAPANVDTRTGEVRGAQPTPPPARAPAPQPDPQPAQAPQQTGSYMDLVNSVDISTPLTIPRNADGSIALWGVTVPGKVYDGWNTWSQYPVTDEPKTDAQKARVKAMQDKEFDTGKKNPLLHYTWAEMAMGSGGGARETALRWLVARARNGEAAGKKLYQDDQRAAVALDEMLRLRAAGEGGNPNDGPW